jgi:2,4-dienoyl-CoA reductase-like NADH-dependent reductase (Old Yellow Enzyme family)
MSALFRPFALGGLEVKNRFVSSACEDNFDTDSGEVTERIIMKTLALSDGGTGLMISAQMFVHHLGKTRPGQLGIHSHAMILGLRGLAESAHRHDGKIIFQLGHAGLQTSAKTIGRPPLGPSSDAPMSEDEIREVIEAFIMAAQRAVEAGADGVQIHAAHGYLINEFLSPYFNRREDSWGGSQEKRFRLLKEIVEGVRRVLPPDKALLIKLNSNDYTPEEGITPALAGDYAERLVGLGVDGLEISCGGTSLAAWNMCRGTVPVREILSLFPEDQRRRVEAVLESKKGQYALVEAYNLEDAKRIRPFAKDISLISVGGWRSVRRMEDAIEKGEIDLIAMCRPFIRDPYLVGKIKSGEITKASCTSCNRCLAALANDMPAQCYMR